MHSGADETSKLLSLSRSFYDAAAAPELWPEIWSDVVRSFGGISGSLFVSSPDSITPIAFPGFSERALQLYAAHYHRSDPWVAMVRATSNAGLLGQEFVSSEKFETSETWQDFSRPHVGAFHIVGAGMPMSGKTRAMLGIHRARDAEAFGATEQRGLTLLLPHLRHSLELARILSEAEIRGRTGFAALQALGLAVVIVTADRRVIFVNRAAEKLAGGDGLLLVRDGASSELRLGTCQPAITRRLVQVVADAARGGPGGGLRLREATEDGRTLTIMAMPLPHHLGEGAGAERGAPRLGNGFALVLVRNDAQPVALPLEILEALYGLTPAEAGVAQALLGGRTAEEVAVERGVSPPTVRSHIRSILEKTGARSLRDLDRYISTM